MVRRYIRDASVVPGEQRGEVGALKMLGEDGFLAFPSRIFSLEWSH
jgi:hypothetical protein